MKVNAKNFRQGKKTFIINAALLLSLCCFFTAVVFGISGVFAADNTAVSDTGIEEKYNIGEELVIPKGTVTVNGQEYEVQPIVYYPDGKALAQSVISLDQLGKYTLEYTVEVNGKIYTEKVEFYVYDYLFVNSATGQPLKYGSKEDYDAEGILFSICPSEKILYNNIIDLNTYGPNDVLIKLDATPAEKGVPEARDLYVRLTDVYNPDNYITFRNRRAPTIEDQNASYITASYGNNPLSGWSGTTLYQGHENYGAGGWNGLNGNWDETSPVEVRFDYANKTMYTYVEKFNSLNKVVNFSEDFGDNVWSGFTTGEVYLSIWADTYATSNILEPFNGIILEIDRQDLSDGISEDGTVPSVEINETKAPEIIFGEYENEYNIPDAMVGYSYKVFDSKFYSVYGAEKVSTHVYYGYNSSSRFEVPIDNGYFTPEIDGVYTIVYSLTDRFGNSENTLLDVYARKYSSDGIKLTVAGVENHSTGFAGYPFTIPSSDDISVSGNLGNVTVSVSAKHSESGETAVISDSTFYPMSGGEWEITYTAVDYVGRIGMFSYTARVDVDEEVVFNEVENLNDYFIVGAKNPIPDLYVTDYNDEGNVFAAPVIYIEKDGEKISDVTDGWFVPHSSGKYFVVYGATSAIGVNSVKKLPVTAVDVGFGKDNFDMSKYFYSENMISATSDASSVYLTLPVNEKADFILPVDTKNFGFSFNIATDVQDASSIVILLTDVNNEDQSLMFEFINSGNGVAFRLNGGTSTSLPDYKFGGGADIRISLKAGIVTIGKTQVTVNS